MELITILLSALLGILSPVGIVADRLAASAIRDRLDSVEQLAVRIDSAPSYQLLQGRADRVRIAGRGVFPVAGVRIDTLEVETDPIALNLRSRRTQLDRPLQAGVRLVLTETDLNRALQSPRIARRLRNLSLNLLGDAASAQRYRLINPQVQFLPNSRVRLRVTLAPQTQRNTATVDRAQIEAETGLSVVAGHQLQLLDPVVKVNDQPLPPELVNLFLAGVSSRFDLNNLERSGITARVLKLQTAGDRLELAAFVRVESLSALSGK